MSLYNVAESVKAQKEYCEKNGAPHFAPSGGSCWKCNKNIYEPIERKVGDYFSGKVKSLTTGITVEEAGCQLVTGCPHCNRSYCD